MKGKPVSNPVPTPPYKVSLSNLFPGSDHPDVATLQAAVVRNLGVTNLPISGVYDHQTEVTLKNFSLSAKAKKSDIRLSYANGLPTENFIRLVGLEIR